MISSMVGVMCLTHDGYVWLVYVNTNVDIIGILGLGCNNNRGYPGCRAIHFLDYVVMLHLFQLFLDLLADMKRDPSVWLGNRLYGFVDVKLYFVTFELAYACE